MDLFLEFVTPTPQPPLIDEPSWFDSRAITTGVIVLAIGSLGLFLRRAIARGWRTAGGWFKDKWKRLRTPVEGGPLETLRAEVTAARGTARTARHERDMAKSAMDAMQGELHSAWDLVAELNNQLAASKAAHGPVPEVPLPARWSHFISWTGDYEAQLTVTNRGPGVAYHVTLDNGPGFLPPDGEDYWEVLEGKKSIVTTVVARRGSQPMGRNLIMKWTNSEGELQRLELGVLSMPPGEAGEDPPF